MLLLRGVDSSGGGWRFFVKPKIALRLEPQVKIVSVKGDIWNFGGGTDIIFQLSGGISFFKGGGDGAD